MQRLRENNSITDEQDLRIIKAWTARGGQYEQDYPLSVRDLNRLNTLADSNSIYLEKPLYRMIDLSFNKWNTIFKMVTGIDFRPLKARYLNAMQNYSEDPQKALEITADFHNKEFDVVSTYRPKFDRFQSFTPDFFRVFSYSTENSGHHVNWSWQDNYRIIYAIPNHTHLKGLHIKDYSVYTDEDEYLISNKNNFTVVAAQLFSENTIILMIQP